MKNVVGVCIAIAALAAGCKKEDTPTKQLAVTRSLATIVADGVSTSIIHVEGAQAVPITITTRKGVFVESNGASVSVNALVADVTLRSCDATTSATCVGAAGIVATDGAGTAGYSSVTFTTTEICDNGVDDDMDGLTDCQDPNCPASVACGPNGLVCSSNHTCTTCSGAGGVAEPSGETSCADGFDNDCDGKIDCADSDCDGKACSGAGIVGTCVSGACACQKTETTETSCSDGIDNDCDGKVDCDDPNCLGKVCDVQKGLSCGGTPIGCSVCTSGQKNELPSQCGDGKDNDCDGLIDCDDPDCSGQACNAFGGVCTGASGMTVCSCASGQVAETSCNDGIDNDCNGKTDCADPNCAGQQCGPTAASTCQNSECVDSATKYAIALTTARPRLPAVANALSNVLLDVKFDGKPSIGTLVDLAVDDPTLGSVTPTSVQTNGAGDATFAFKSTGALGVATIRATVHGVGTSGTTTIEMPALGEIRLASMQYPVLGVKYSGFQESSNLTVQVYDLAQKAYPAGLPVLFRHLTLGGSTLTLPPVPDVPGVCVTPSCVGYQAVTDDQGIARVTIYSGSVAGTVPVQAFASAGGQPERTFDIPSLAIIGAKPSGAHLAVVCSPENVPAYASTDCYNSLVDAPFTCLAIVKDRFNNIVGRATTVTFMSEAGAVGQPATTPSYDPKTPPEQQANLGEALEIINTLGNRLPKDVTPHQGTNHPYGGTLVPGNPEYEYGLDYDDNRCLRTVHNPRDGLVTIIASTPGEEGFFDANGNGVYDDGEPFVDLGEPFVDYNDNSIRDPDEPFIDSNSNGVYDGPNGKWDGNTKIWAQTTIVYSGVIERSDVGGTAYYSRWMTEADVGKWPAPTTIPTVPATPSWQLYRVGAMDVNFNPAANGYYTLSWNDPDVRQWPSWSPPPTRGVSVLNWACDAADLTKCANDCAFVASAKPHDRCVMRSVVRGYQYGFTLDENVSTGWLPYWFSASVLGRTTDIMLHGP